MVTSLQLDTGCPVETGIHDSLSGICSDAQTVLMFDVSSQLRYRYQVEVNLFGLMTFGFRADCVTRPGFACVFVQESDVFGHRSSRPSLWFRIQNLYCL